jgi:hypothetical protein
VGFASQPGDGGNIPCAGACREAVPSRACRYDDLRDPSAYAVFADLFEVVDFAKGAARARRAGQPTVRGHRNWCGLATSLVARLDSFQCEQCAGKGGLLEL